MLAISSPKQKRNPWQRSILSRAPDGGNGMRWDVEWSNHQGSCSSISERIIFERFKRRLVCAATSKNMHAYIFKKFPHVVTPSRPNERGVSRSSRTRGGMRWTRQRRACGRIAGRGNLVSGQSARDERRCGVRQKCVVLAAVAGVKSAEFWSAQPGAGKTYSQATEARRVRLGGESRKDIACAVLLAVIVRESGRSSTPGRR